MAIDQTTASSPTSSDEGSHRHGPIGVILDIAVRFRWAIIVLTVFAAIYAGDSFARTASMFPTSPTRRCRSTPVPLRFRLRKSKRR